MFADWRIPTRGFPWLTQSLFPWEIFLLYTAPGKCSFSRAPSMLKHTDNQALAQVNALLTVLLPGFIARKDRIVCGHVWTNQTTWQGTRLLIGLCMQRLGGGLFSPLSLLNEELQKTCPPSPIRFSKMRTEPRSFSLGGNLGLRQGTGSAFPHFRDSWDLKQLTEEKPTWTKGSPRVKCLTFPQKGLISCSAAAHKRSQGFWAPQVSPSPGCWPHWVIFKHSLQDSTTWWTVAQISEASSYYLLIKRITCLFTEGSGSQGEIHLAAASSTSAKLLSENAPRQKNQASHCPNDNRRTSIKVYPQHSCCQTDPLPRGPTDACAPLKLDL